MAKSIIHIERIGAKINDQGIDVLRDILDNHNDVVIGASAGTGKTTLLTNILAEAIIRELLGSGSKKTTNPFDSIIAATFTVEASRQMKEKTRELLTEYCKTHTIQDFDSIIYALETDSWIMTIDSLTQRILRMVSLDIGIPPDVDIIDEFDNARILSVVFEKLRVKFPDEIGFLELATRERTRELLKAALDCISLYVIDEKELIARMKKSFTEFYNARLNLGSDKGDVRTHNQTIFKHFKKILPDFINAVREKYRKEGAYTYDELRRLLVEFLRKKDAADWKDYFGNRFKFLLVDEFQDTSVAQTELLSYIVGPDTRIMIIGDPKQSIYTWRNAEPEILSKIISAAEDQKPDKNFKRRFNYHPITINFRSVLPLVEMSNYLFSAEQKNSLFEDKEFTRGLNLPNPKIDAQSPHPPNKSDDPPHIHVFFTNAKSRKEDKHSEPEFVAHILGKLANNKLDIKVRKEENGAWVWKKPTLGDCAVLIPRRGAKWKDLKKRFIKSNIPFVMIQDQGFYQRPEISLLIDFLDWLGDPFQNDALLRILRSPFVGASDYVLRILTGEKCNFRLDICATELDSGIAKVKNKSKISMIKRDQLALQRVMNLKRNLRWSREGRKANLLEAILQSSHFREILMTYPEGEQCVANLGLLCDTVDSWEAEEIISYQELVRRLKFYRTSDPSYQSQAVLSDLGNKDAVKVSTIHSTKGLEFPIVFILDVDFGIKNMWSWRNAGRMGVSPRLIYSGSGGKFIHLRQLTPPSTEYDLWKKISDIYANEQKGKSGFRKDMGDIYADFFAEKWRLYYVGLTRARDHVFHCYNSASGNAKTWGNEFRTRITEFQKTTPPKSNWCSEILNSPTMVETKAQKKGVIQYKPSSKLKDISKKFHPLVIDPTHVYDLILCPRRYQYGSLMGATGAKCHEAGHSQFSPLFGAVLHELLEKFDYANNDTQQAIAHLASLDYVPKNDQDLLKEGVVGFAEFVKNNLNILSDPTHHVLSEKEIHARLILGKRPTELRGIIDLVDISGTGVGVYDIKSNYLTSAQGDSNLVKLRREFMRNHHEYQLLTYEAMVESSGYQVSGVYVIAISMDSNFDLQWNLFNVKTRIDVIAAVDGILPLTMEENGLPIKKNKFCPICEYRYMCGVNI